MRMTKKITSIVLAVLMVVSMVVVGSVVASAATTVTTYDQFKAALDTEAYGTIVLGDDITGTEQLTFTKTVTIDLNGHTLTNTAPWNAAAKEYYGDFVIGNGGYCNVKFTGTGTVNLNNYMYGFKVVSGALNIGANVTCNCPEGNMVLGGSLTVNGTINTTNWFAIGTNGSKSHDYSITINDGAYVKSTAADAAAIYHCNDGELVINGGTLEGATAVIVKSGTTEINGGTLKATGAKTAFVHNGNGADPTGDALLVESCEYPGGTPVIKVTGGSFQSANAAAVASYTQDATRWDAATEFIKGGEFQGADAVDTDCFVSGTTVTQEGGKTVVKYYICEDAATGTKYESVDEALDAAGEGGTVKLIKDVAVNGDDGNIGISIKHNGTFDLNGYTITGTKCSAVTIYATSVSGKTLTFKDSVGTGGITTTCKYPGDACISDSSSGSVIIESGTYTSDKRALYCSSSDGWTINGGTFNGDIILPQNDSNLTMTGGTVNGEVKEYNPFNTVDAEINISGGTFSNPVPEEYCADGYIPKDNGDGTYGVKTGSYVAQVGTDKYETLQEAIDAAQAGDTVKLLADITDTSIKYQSDPRFAYFVTGKSEITIDGNGHTVNVGGRGFGVAGDGVGADITFKNITINNTTSDGRAIDTRGNKIASLTLDNVTLYTPTGASQALTIGGNQASTTDVNIKDSTLEARYAITTFNPVDMTIDGSEITGWACLNIKAASSSEGSHGSTFTVTDSTLNSMNPFAGATNSYALIKIEDNDVDVNITGSTLNINGANNNQAIVACETFPTPGYTYDNTVTLGDGNTVNFSGDTSYVSVAPADGEGMVISGGAFSEPVPAELCADTYVPVVNGDGTYGVGIETNPLNPIEKAAADINDGNAFGLECDYLKGTLLGVQKKSVAGEDTSSQEGAKNIRFVAVLDTELLQDADDYGFVLAKVGTNKTTQNTNFNNLKAYWGNGEKTISAMGTYNNVCGNTAYGDPEDTSTSYKYVTCAVNNVDDNSKIAARFFYKKDGKTYYAKYSAYSYAYTGCTSSADAT